MNREPLQILLLEDNPGDARLVEDMLRESLHSEAQLKWVQELSELLKEVKQKRYDLILTDLSVPDSVGIKTFQKIHANVPNIPIVILTGTFQEGATALQAIRQGAQDYIVKTEMSPNFLARLIRYAIERKRSEAIYEQVHALEERMTIARELHDNLGHSLAELKTDLLKLKDMPVADLADQTEKMSRKIDLLIEIIREVSTRKQ